jgi:hypothetical protein
VRAAFCQDLCASGKMQLRAVSRLELHARIVHAAPLKVFENTSPRKRLHAGLHPKPIGRLLHVLKIGLVAWHLLHSA